MRYEDETVELGPNFNAITGPTDSGKSTLLRALVWVFYNKPSGKGILRSNPSDGETVVSITTSSGVEVSRVRNSSVNGYILNGTTYTAVGNNVPEPIQDALGIRLAELGPKNFEQLNVSRQLDGPFMLSDTGGNASKILGNLSGISTLDVAIASCKADISAFKRDIESAQKSEAAYLVTIKEFENIDEERETLDHCRDLLARAEETSARKESLLKLQEQMVSLNGIQTGVDAKLRCLSERNGKVEGTLARARTYQEALRAAIQTKTDMDGLNEDSKNIKATLKMQVAHLALLEKQKHGILVTAGKCPTCGAVQH